MASPITEWSETIGGSGTALDSSYRKGWKQTRPIDKTMVLSYEARRSSVGPQSSTGEKMWAHQTLTYGNPDTISSLFPRVCTDTTNRSYAKLMGKIQQNGSASLGEALGEIGQSYRMVAERSSQILQFVKGLRKGRFGDAWAALAGVNKSLPTRWQARRGLTNQAPKWQSDRTVASLFLEAHLGWEPLIKDIYSAVNVLQSPFVLPFAVKASTGSPFQGDLAVPVDFTNVNAVYPQSWRRLAYTNIKGEVRSTQGCQVRVTNPNLWLANQLGLLNPVETAWNLVPWSFVFDWVNTLGDVLGSASDLYGLSVSGGYTTLSVKASYRKYNEDRYKYLQNGSWVYGGGVYYDVISPCTGMRRGVGLTLPSLQFRPFKAPGLMRATTAVSLLMQQLPKK